MILTALGFVFLVLVAVVFGTLGILAIYFTTKSFGGSFPFGSLAIIYVVYGLFLLDGMNSWGEASYVKTFFVLGPIAIFCVWAACMLIHWQRDRETD